jgi:hypothetical protein
MATTTAVPEAGVTGGRTPPTVFERLRARQKKEQERISGKKKKAANTTMIEPPSSPLSGRIIPHWVTGQTIFC